MRIIHVVNEAVDTGNGIVNATVDLACMQAQAGHQVSFVSSGGGYLDLLARHDVRHYAVNLRPRPVLDLVRDLPQLKRLVTELKPDIVHAHMMTGAVLMWLGRSIGGFGNYGLVTTIHNEWRPTSLLMLLGDRVVVLSQAGKAKFLRRGFPARKLQVVAHGILQSPRRMREFDSDDDWSTLKANGPLIVTMAGMYIRKGIGDLIEAFGAIADEFPNATLSVAGWGPAQSTFEKQKSLVRGGERIRFLGFLSQPRSLLRQADIFVLASHTESFSLAIAEAREAGCAVIGTTVGGIPELLEDGRAGLLVPPHNIEALTQALRRLLGDARELDRWREAAHANLEWLSCARMEQETMAVYASLLRERNAA